MRSHPVISVATAALLYLAPSAAFTLPRIELMPENAIDSLYQVPSEMHVYQFFATGLSSNNS